jgi:demethylmenaquinone methyltransferase / 2-methoxy-6-polyprenyl-1,4-benzoquinol methylase
MGCNKSFTKWREFYSPLTKQNQKVKLNPPMPDAKVIRGLFSSIAKEYNRMNTLMTLGLDGLQRARVADAVAQSSAQEIVDLASGTGMLAFAIAEAYEKKQRPCRIMGIDFCPELLRIAREELKKKQFAHAKIEFTEADALHTPLPNESVDAVTMGFGLRNFESRAAAYAEILRVLKPGGRCFILETSQPKGLMWPVYKLLWAPLVPLLARLAGSNPNAYQYLVESSKMFPDAEALAAEMTAAGFREVTFKRMQGGTLALHIGFKAK